MAVPSIAASIFIAISLLAGGRTHLHAKFSNAGARSFQPEPHTEPPMSLLQRVHRNLTLCQSSRHVVLGCRIGTSSLRKGGIFRAPSMQQPRQAIVAFKAARLDIESIFLIALLTELLLDCPRTRPHRRIFDRDLVGECPWTGAGPALDQVQVLARAKDLGFRTEVGHVDHERVALPTAAGVAVPLTDAGRQMRAPVHRDVALPPLPLTHVVEDRDAARGLHDTTKTASGAAKFRPSGGQAALRQRTVLRTVVAIHPRGIVARRSLGAPRRWRWIVCPAGTARQFVLAGIGRSHQSETILPFGCESLLSLRRQRWKPAIGRIDNLRRPRPGPLGGKERRGIVGAIDLALGREPGENRSSLFVEVSTLLFGEKLLARISGRALQGRIKFVGPYPLQIGFTPRSLQSRAGNRWSLSSGLGERHRTDNAHNGGGNGGRDDRA